jgi:hypothetical protein
MKQPAIEMEAFCCEGKRWAQNPQISIATTGKAELIFFDFV